VRLTDPEPYLVAQIAAALAAGIRPDTSILGIVWLAATTGAMSLLAWGKARAGRAALVSDRTR
jgi:hypothetical protein